MPRSNYGQVKRQKEAARKARHQKKLDRRQARTTENAPADDGSGTETSGIAPPGIPDGDMPP